MVIFMKIQDNKKDGIEQMRDETCDMFKKMTCTTTIFFFIFTIVIYITGYFLGKSLIAATILIILVIVPVTIILYIAWNLNARNIKLTNTEIIFSVGGKNCEYLISDIIEIKPIGRRLRIKFNDGKSALFPDTDNPIGRAIQNRVNGE